MGKIDGTIEWTKKIGNFVSNLLLGETKEIILKSAVKIDEMEKDIGEIKPDLKDIRERFAGLEGKLSGSLGSASPIHLKPKGTTILEKSGLKKYIDDNKTDLLSKCQSKEQMITPYDIQTATFKFFDEMQFEKEFEDKLKTTAYEEGVSLDVVRRVGGIYFRDICLHTLGHKPEDLDQKLPNLG